MLWIDKYAPKHIQDLSCHTELNTLIAKLAKKSDIPHLLFYGPSGAGKKTRIMVLLRQLFGPGVDKMTTMTLTAPNSAVEYISVNSNFHTQINVSELGSKDLGCVQTLVKGLASQTSAISFAFAKTNVPKHRVLLLQEADMLGFEAQAGLRRTMEKYIRNCRIILHCDQLAPIIAPLRSRCMCIRVPHPRVDEIETVLQKIAKEESLGAPCDPQRLRKIAENCGRDLRRAILVLEVMVVEGNPDVIAISEVPWEAQCHAMVSRLLADPTPATLLEIRENAYDLWAQTIPGDVILEALFHFLLKEVRADGQLRLKIAQAAAHFSHTMRAGSKPVWHIEAFMAQVASFAKIRQLEGIS